jgi:hypothetical protein
MCNHQVFRTMRLPVGSRQMHKQAGFVSILFILLIGLALTVLVVGMVTSVRSLQDSSLTTHAQTQAQIKSAIGYQALTGLLKPLSATQIAQIDSGEIKDNGSTPAATIATYKVVTTGCPTSTSSQSYFCYDITAKSGGASSVVRAIYTDITTGGGAFNGSIFAGGLQVGHEKNLKGDQMIQVGGRGNGEVSGNGSNFFTSDQFFENSKYDDKTGGIRTGVYTPTTFLTAEELRSYANYIFYADGKCAKNNLYSVVSSIATTITAETDPPVACSDISGITTSGSGTDKAWVIDASKSTIPVGVLWFEGVVTINLSKDRDLVNTIIATKDIIVSTDTSGAKGSISNAYAPYHYNSESSKDTSTKKDRICGSNSTGIPTQYCNTTTGELKALDTEKAKIANILFLTNGSITFGAKKDYPMNLYGNMLGIRGSGGTGAASGKFTGNGDINIKGNLTFTGLDFETTTNGTVNIKLKSVDSGGSATPSKKVMTLSGLRYM